MSVLAVALVGVNNAQEDLGGSNGYPIGAGVGPGNPVYLLATQANIFGVRAELAVGTSEATAQVIGIMGPCSDSLGTAFGEILTFGAPFISLQPELFDAGSNVIPGAIVYLSPTNAGKYTTVKPQDGWLVKIGTIVPTSYDSLPAFSGLNVISINISAPIAVG